MVRSEPGVVETKVEGAIAPVEDKGKPVAGVQVERRWTIRGDGRAAIWRRGAKAADVAFSVIPAGVPTIALSKDPVSNLSGSLTLAYRIEDRYGIASARADFALPPDPSGKRAAEPRSGASGRARDRRHRHRNRRGERDARSLRAPVGGRQGDHDSRARPASRARQARARPVEVILPQRPFHNPLARALVEERRDLILDPDHAPKRIEAALTGLAVAPELFGTPAGVYLGLRQAKASLDGARTDADLLEVAQLLWTMALKIEDGDATQAQRDLRAAEQALRDALKRGASDDEIRKLMQNLREAAQRFAAEMAMKAEKNGDQTPQESNQEAQNLDKLMDQLEQTARNGTREQAEAMLDQMQNMFENMQSAENQEESPAERELRKQMDELGKLMRDQQALRDDTFRSDQRDQKRRRSATPGDGSQAQPDDGGDPQANEGDNAQDPGDDKGADQERQKLGDRQQDLADRLAQMQRMLKGLGMKGEKGFDDAEGDMKEAQGDLEGDKGQKGQGRLGQSGKGAAVDAQGRALQALREGAQGMQQQMQAQGQGGKRGYQARRMRPGEQQGDDPLGRQQREGDMGRDDGSLKDMGTVAERARRVMEELRRRLADPNRPVDERDYLERLMNHN